MPNTRAAVHAVLAPLAFLLAILSADQPAAAAPLSVTAVSARPDMVSETSVLIQVDDPAGVDPKTIILELNGQRQPGPHLKVETPGRALGLVDGLRPGANVLVVKSGERGRQQIARLDLTVYPKAGPIFSGPQQAPWICQTAEFALPDGSTLGQPVDKDCDAATKVQFLYMPKGQAQLRVWTAATPAQEIASTTTTGGQVVPFVVRLETGTLNRAIYQIAILSDPAEASTPDPLTPPSSWNGKLIYSFAGSASAGYVQGVSTGGVLNPFMLARGYAVASSSLNVFGYNANDVLSAETAMMLKERFIVRFGRPIYTMGWGASGGAMQQHLIANNYPGLLDGIVPMLSFPDLLSVTDAAEDCALLSRAFAAMSDSTTDAQKTAVSGYASFSACDGAPSVTAQLVQQSWEASYSPSWMTATRLAKSAVLRGTKVDLSNCLQALPDRQIYDPVTNRTGARCDIYSAEKNELGVDPATRFTLRPWDNVGVEYGLGAYRSGAINGEQFVQLNEKIGGYDEDGRPQADRTAAPVSGLEAAYAGGRLNQMSHLAGVPILDIRGYSEQAPGYDIHDSSESEIIRARLQKATGSSSNQVIIRFQPGPDFLAHQPDALAEMDRWLTQIRGDLKPGSLAEKVARNKPADLVDACYAASGTKIPEPADLDNRGQCGGLYPFFSNPRRVAGAPLTNDVLKCRLKPPRRIDYAGLSDAQFERLRAVFGAGVCDYTQASVGYAPLKGTWLRYPSPGVIQAGGR